MGVWVCALCLWKWMQACEYHTVCRGQRTAFGSPFSSFTLLRQGLSSCLSSFRLAEPWTLRWTQSPPPSHCRDVTITGVSHQFRVFMGTKNEIQVIRLMQQMLLDTELSRWPKNYSHSRLSLAPVFVFSLSTVFAWCSPWTTSCLASSGLETVKRWWLE